MREIGYAIRRLCTTPTFTLAATLTMAIAIGATASVFAVVDAALLKPFPFRDANRVLMIMESNSRLHLPWFSVAPAKYLDWRTQTRAFSMLAAVRGTYATVTGSQEPERAVELTVTPNYFRVLGMTPVLGRALATDSGGPAEVVISYAYWQSRFGGNPAVLGRVLTVDDRPYTVVGVAPEGWPGGAQLWIRLSLTNKDEIDRGGHTLTVYGRLRPSVTRDAGRQELQMIAARLGVAYPQSDKGWSVATKPMLDQWIGDVREALLAVLAAAGCVLLIGAANLANLFLVRCLAREREMAVRTALGATRGRLMRGLMAEATVLSVSAGAIGVGLSVAGVRALRALAPPWLPRLSQVTVDARVVVFCALTSIITVLVFGALPAWQTSQGQLADLIKEGGRGTGSAEHHRLQDGLVVLQVAVALVLITGAGLLVETFQQLRHTTLGFRPEGVLTAGITISAQRYPTPTREASFAVKVAEELAAQPRVVAASASIGWPGQGTGMFAFRVVGDPSPDSSHVPLAIATFIGPGYFRTMGILVHKGRGILPSDDSGAVKVVVIDDLLARRFFAGCDPIGRQLRIGPDTATIVGVAASVKQLGAAEQDQAALYLAMQQALFLPGFATVAVRTLEKPERMTAGIKETVSTLDPAAPVSDIKTMNARLNEIMGTTRFSTFLAALFAVVALVLGAVGIYSVLAYVVDQRRREIAVRIALGARRGHVMIDVLRRALVLAGIGIALGSAAAWILVRPLASLLTGVNPHDPSVFIGAAAGFALVAATAASIPALRASRVEPMVALTSM